MSVTEVKQALGAFSVTLRPTVTKELLDALVYFGHIAIVEGRVNVAAYGDGLLTAARYVGVYRNRVNDVDNRSSNVEGSYVLNGVGLAFWLGDESGKGDVFEAAVTLNAATFANSIRALLPPGGAVTEGTLHSIAGTYTGRHQYQTPRQAIEYVCDTYSAEWRVNGNATIDAGLPANLYPSTPTATLVKHGHGRDPSLVGYQGKIDSAEDVEDFTTRVVLLAEGEGLSIATGAANIASNPYKDLRGGAVKLTQVLSESATVPVNANTRAQVLLSEHAGTRRSLRLATSDYVLTGDLGVGGYVWVYDPDTGLVDTANEITYRGQRINPAKYRCTEITWPVRAGMTVAYRSPNGTWYDLTDHVNFEESDTSLTVGELPRSLSGSGVEPVGTRPAVDTSIPAAPTLITPFDGGVYLDGRGFSRAQMRVVWSAPLNTDGSTIIDGDHYEVRYAVDTDITYPATWAQIASRRWDQLNTWAQPSAFPTGAWNVAYAAWGSTSVLIQDLSPGVGYDFQIRAVDKAGNFSAWSAITTAVATPDNIAPSPPAAPEVAASRIALQVTHRLGKASGGTFNLEADLDHLEIHVDVEPTFFPTEATLKGKLRSTAGMIQATVPAVGTFPVESTAEAWVKVVAVDISGNKSLPSAAASSTALLIDNAHISDLTVSKVTAGVIGADWIVGASIKTANAGARVELSSLGLLAYNQAGTQTVNVSSANGSVSIIGQLRTGSSGERIDINPPGNAFPVIRFYPNDGGDYAQVNGFGSTDSGLALTSSAIITNSARQSLTADYILLAFANTIGGEGQIYMHRTGVDLSGQMKHFGTWADFVDLGAGNGLFTGHLDVTAASVSVTVSYGTTSTSLRWPIVSVNDDGAPGTAAVRGFHVTTVISTSFTVELSGAATGGWSVYFWAFRI